MVTATCTRCGAQNVPLVANVDIATSDQSSAPAPLVAHAQLCAMCAVVVTIVLGGGDHVVLGLNSQDRTAMVNASNMDLVEAAELLATALDMVAATS